MHKLQKILLKRLSNKNNQRYGELAKGYDFEDNIVFHLKKLISDKFITKVDGIYSITLNGVKQISKFEPFELEDKGVKTFFIGFVCDDGNENYLVKEHPQAQSNFYNLPSGKPFFGEKIEDAIIRTFLINTGFELSADKFELLSLHLKTIKSQNEEIVFDDAFGIYKVSVNNKIKNKMSLMKSVKWFSKNEIERLENKWPEIDMCILEKDLSNYRAYSHISNYIL